MAPRRGSSPSSDDTARVIFGLDHIAWAGTLTPAREALLRHLGYLPVLTADQLGNLDIKRPWLHQYGERHALALFRAPQGVGLEVVDHYHTHGAADRLLPVFHGSPPLHDDDRVIEATTLGPVFSSKALGLTYLLTPGARGPVREVVWRTPDTTVSATFWRRFGFTVDSIDPCHLRFRGVDGVACDLTLLPTPTVSASRLDAEGVTSLAFVTTSIERDLAEMAAAGLSVSPVAEITPGGTRLAVAFVEGPDGALVELIGSR